MCVVVDDVDVEKEDCWMAVEFVASVVFVAEAEGKTVGRGYCSCKTCKDSPTTGGWNAINLVTPSRSKLTTGA